MHKTELVHQEMQRNLLLMNSNQIERMAVFENKIQEQLQDVEIKLTELPHVIDKKIKAI